MLHSGLFDAWRIPIATCVSWFGSAEGGAFTFYPKGPNAQRGDSGAHNSAIIIDTDQVFHGVERVSQKLPDLPPIEKSARLYFRATMCGNCAMATACLAIMTGLKFAIRFLGKPTVLKTPPSGIYGRREQMTGWDFIVNRLEEALRDQGALTRRTSRTNSFCPLAGKPFCSLSRRRYRGGINQEEKCLYKNKKSGLTRTLYD